ncbi:hypothetical protein QR680_014301 [Steinernema hermaphroditum]|uniref:PUL domain-containing protein n=1 Tax=Steinernema hermaphroditum TaxID=289476 RepID=A0AA39IAQ6_9BILA|nr:hypothetical protein QR680_014301 [Steinernema hermaphroditum]
MPDLVLCDIGSGHVDDVKAIAKQDGGFTSVGRDGSVFLWESTGSSRFLVNPVTQTGAAANAVAVMKGHDGQENVFVGLSSGSIVCISPLTGAICCTLSQHTANVCALYADQEARILISGSWDETAIVWDLSGLYDGLIGECKKIVLRGHQQSVWAVTSAFSPNHFLTGSADKTIKYWEGETLLKSMTAPDIVRAIERLPNNRFYTLFNSGSVGLWDLESGSMLAKYNTLSGEFMYSMKPVDLANGQKYLITCGEGGHVEIFARDENNCLSSTEVFQLPASSVWSVQVVGEDKVAFGASDKCVYVYSFNKEFKTDPDVQAAFQQKMKATESDRLRKKDADDNVTIKVSLAEGAPTLDLRYRKGTDPAVAAQEFILENNLPQQHFLDIVEFIKRNVPDYAKGESASKRQKDRIRIDGEVYDFALDVTLGGGKEVKIGYNSGEDYDMAAQRFIKKHGIPPSMGPHLSSMLKTQFPASAAQSTNGADPLTGSHRYVPDDTSENNPIRPVSHLYPLREPMYFEKCPVSADKAVGKLKEFNDTQEDGLRLDEAELSSLATLFKQGEPDDATLIRALEKGLDWPLQNKLPIVDLLRLAVLRPKVHAHFFAARKETLAALRAVLLTSSEQNVVMTVCRVLCNAFKHPQGRDAMTNDIQNWIKILVGSAMRQWPTAQVAASCALTNYAYYLSSYIEKHDNVGPREDALFSILMETNQAFEGEMNSNEGAFRMNEDAMTNILKSMVSLLWGDRELIKLAKQNGITNLARNMVDCIAGEDGKIIAREIICMVESV